MIIYFGIGPNVEMGCSRFQIIVSRHFMYPDGIYMSERFDLKPDS